MVLGNLFGGGGKDTIVSNIENVNKMITTATKNYLNKNTTEVDGDITVLNEIVAENVTFGAGCSNSEIGQKANVKSYITVNVDQLSNVELASEVAASFKDTFDNSVEKKQDFLGQGIDTVGKIFGTTTHTETSTKLENTVKQSITSNVTNEQIKDIVMNYDLTNTSDLKEISFDPCGMKLVAPYFKDDPDLLIDFLAECGENECVIEQDIAVDAMTQDISKLIMSSIDKTSSNIETEQDVTQSTVVEQDTIGTIADFFSNPWVIFAIICFAFLYFFSTAATTASASSPPVVIVKNNKPVPPTNTG